MNLRGRYVAACAVALAKLATHACSHTYTAITPILLV